MASMTLHARNGRKKWRDALAASVVLESSQSKKYCLRDNFP